MAHPAAPLAVDDEPTHSRAPTTIIQVPLCPPHTQPEGQLGRSAAASRKGAECKACASLSRSWGGRSWRPPPPGRRPCLARVPPECVGQLSSSLVTVAVGTLAQLHRRGKGSHQQVRFRSAPEARTTLVREHKHRPLRISRVENEAGHKQVGWPKRCVIVTCASRCTQM